VTSWFMRLVHAASDRFDAWRARRDAAFDTDPQVVEIRRINRENGAGVEDTGVVTPTALDLAAIAPHMPKQRRGHRLGDPPRHAKPKEKDLGVTFRFGDKEEEAS
jgi:hypothetical protein